MKIHLQGFRCYDDQEYVFSDTGITLIQGPSGQGKSTIMDAIFWCLYGSLRNIYHPLYPNRKCCVTLELPQLTIMRSTKPASLDIIINGQTFHEQHIIDYLFGTKDVWLSSSYLSQGSRCHWMELSADERLNTIERIVYAEQSPDIFLSRATSHLTNITESYNRQLNTFNVNQKVFESKGSYDTSLVLDNLQPLQLQIKTLEEAWTRNKKLLETQNLMRGKMLKIQEQVHEIQQELSKLHPIDEVSIRNKQQQVEDHVRQVSQYQEYMKRKEFKERIWHSYQQLDPEHCIQKCEKLPILNDVVKHEVLYSQYQGFLQELQRYGVKEEELYANHEQEIQQLNTKIQQHAVYCEYLKTKEQLDKLPVLEPIQDVESLIQQCRNKLNNVPGKELECPTCHAKLEMDNRGCLIHYRETVNPVEVRQELERLNAYVLNKQQREQLTYRLNNYTVKEDPNINVIEGKKRIEYLQRLIQLRDRAKVITVKEPLPYTSKALQAYIDYNNLMLGDPIQQPPELDVDALKREINMCMTTNTKHKELQQRLLKLQQEQTTITIDETLEGKVKQQEENLRQLRDKLSQHERANDIHQQYLRLVEEYNNLNNLYQQQYIAQRLTAIIEHTEYQLLEDTIGTFNACLNEICSTLFQEPITVKLELWKTTKTTQRTKPNIHLDISYKGMQLNGIVGLSGGEAGRISLALVIAFYMIHPQPVMLLDESMSSVNHNVRELCLLTIRKFVKCPVIVISHEDNEGLYDHVVNF